jgi:hypothetical protein
MLKFCLTMIIGFVAMISFQSNSLFDSVVSAAAAAEVSGNPAVLSWDDLRGLDPRTGSVPANLKKFDGALVRIAGYIVPLEDGSHQVSEFLLVPYPTDCIHVPPPPTNQIVHVKMEKTKKVIFGSVDAYWATGQLKIERTESV